MRKYCMEIPFWQSIVTVSIFKLTLSTICSTIFIYLLTSCDTENKFLSRNNMTESSLDHLDELDVKSNNSRSLQFEKNDHLTTKGKAIKTIHTTYILLSVQFMISCVFSILLLVGAVKSNLLLCKVWCGLTIFEVVFDTILVIVVLVTGESSTVGILIGTCLISLLFLGFVKNFINEIEKELKQKASHMDSIVDPGRESS